VTSRLGACAALSGGFILAGSSVVAAKLLTGLPVFFTAAAGAAIAFLVLLPLAIGEFAAGSKGEPNAARLRGLAKALPQLAAQAFFGVALFRVLMLLALARTSAAVVGVAMSAAPAITTALAAVFLKERIGPRTAAGICLAALGIAALQSGGAATAGAAAGAVWGCLLAVGAAASESIFNVMAKRLAAGIGPRLASAAVMATAALMLGLLSLATGERVALGELGLERALAIVYIGLFSSALAYILWYTGVARLPVSAAGVFSGLMPLSSFALSIAFLGERPRALAFAGSALAIAGVLLCAVGREGAGEAAGRSETREHDAARLEEAQL
jgi:drug/metabolite transporter (DMT)-like permease